MKLTRQSVLTASSLLIGGFIGASALVALASGVSPWKPAPPIPGTCDDVTIPGCFAPINVGSFFQQKDGSLQINGGFGISGGPFVYAPSDVSITDGQVLVASGTDGEVKWGDVSGAVSGGFTNMKVFDANGSWIAPAGVTKVMVEAWGGGTSAFTVNGTRYNAASGLYGTAGSYGKSILTVVPNTTYQIMIGTAAITTSVSTGIGGDTSFSTLMKVPGGNSSSVSVGVQNFIKSVEQNPMAPLGGGTLIAPHSGGSTNYSGLNFDGTVPGGGGGYACYTALGNAYESCSGGLGAHGRVVVYY